MLRVEKTSQESLDDLLKKQEKGFEETGDEEVLLEINGELYEQKLLVDDRMFMARLAERGGRAEEEMAEFIIDMIRAKDKHMVRKSLKEEPYHSDYTRSERNVITVAFKNAIANRRSTIRIIDSTLENPKYAKNRQPLHNYKKKLQDGVFKDCELFLDRIKDYCLDRKGNKMETEAFFCKQAGDLLRYMCEANTQPGPRLKALKDEAVVYYERAGRKLENFHNCNATKLSWGLNFAVFTCEI